jgi:hypothetical protein
MVEMTERAACFAGSGADDRPILQGLGCDELGRFDGKVLRTRRIDLDVGATVVRWGDYPLPKGLAGTQIILCRLMGRKVCVKLETI